jgi:hypothetical protein
VTEPKIRPQDVPSGLVEALLAAANDACVEIPRFEARRLLAAVLPAARKAVLAELFGPPEEIAARKAEAATRKPDDLVRLCDLARPGAHAQRVREQVAAEAAVDDTALRAHMEDTLAEFERFTVNRTRLTVEQTVNACFVTADRAVLYEEFRERIERHFREQAAAYARRVASQFGRGEIDGDVATMLQFADFLTREEDQ